METSGSLGHGCTMRLQRFLARAGVASRRGSENLMTAGRVRVNGRVVTELGSKVDPERDVVSVDGRVYALFDAHGYLMLNKPSGYVTTMSDPQGRPCVASLVPVDRFPGLFPVGRLDADTTGLLLFTTNGDVANRLLHPSCHVWKHYLALVRGVPGSLELERLRRGVVLDDGAALPAEASVLSRGDLRVSSVCPGGIPRGCAVVGLRIREGRKHQVKRMLKHVGHEVLRLHRDQFGPLRLEGVDEGAWRLLEPGEVGMLEELGQKEAAHAR